MNNSSKSILLFIGACAAFAAGYYARDRQAPSGRFTSHYAGGAIFVTDTATGDVKITSDQVSKIIRYKEEITTGRFVPDLPSKP